MNILLCLNLDNVQLTTSVIYAHLLSLKSSPPKVHRSWAPFLGPDFWTRVRDSTDNKMNDLFWLIALHGIKVCDSLPNWVTILMANAVFVLVRKQLITVSSIARPQNAYGHTSGLCLLHLWAMLCQFSNYFLFLVSTT